MFTLEVTQNGMLCRYNARNMLNIPAMRSKFVSYLTYKNIFVSLFIVSLSRRNDINCSGNSSHALKFVKSGEQKLFCWKTILGHYICLNKCKDSIMNIEYRIIYLINFINFKKLIKSVAGIDKQRLDGKCRCIFH